MSKVSLENAGSGIIGHKPNSDLTNTSSSFYALQVALQTMKERCQQLQQRLSTVEEENLRLRIERQRLPTDVSSDESKGEVNVLKEHIAQLTRQKSQLTHHIYMVATENKQLWTRLSRLTEQNHSLGSHLTKISDTLNRHSLAEISKPNESINIMTTCEKETDKLSNGTCVEKDRDASLEEISLKIISSIIREKMELEQQCDQMSALHTTVVSLEECGFAVGVAEAEGKGEGDGSGSGRWRGEEELGRVLDNARDTRDELRRHQGRLRAAVAALASATTSRYTHTGSVPCKKCEKERGATTGMAHSEAPPLLVTSTPTPTPTAVDGSDRSTCTVGEEKVGEGDADVDVDEDRVCPLCGRVFARSTQFDEFHAHVLTHFSDEDPVDDYDMLDCNQ